VTGVQWWDSLSGPDGTPPPNLSRILIGQTITVTVDPATRQYDRDRYDPEGEERTVEIAKITSVEVGVDSERIFVTVNILDENGHGWALWPDGDVTDDDGEKVGRHHVSCRRDITSRVPA